MNRGSKLTLARQKTVIMVKTLQIYILKCEIVLMKYRKKISYIGIKIDCNNVHLI